MTTQTLPSPEESLERIEACLGFVQDLAVENGTDGQMLVAMTHLGRAVSRAHNVCVEEPWSSDLEVLRASIGQPLLRQSIRLGNTRA